MRNYLDFLWAMTEKEIKARYKRAVFGFFWVILNPLLQMIIMGFIFSFFIKIPNYFLFLFIGLLSWTFFSLSIGKATPSIVHERTLLQKAKFPIEAIPLSIILANFFHLLISFLILLLVLVPFGELVFPRALLFIPALFWLLSVTVGVTLLFSSLNVRYRDISFFVQTLLILWFYATPIFYNLSIIPQKFYLFFSLNPLTSIFEILHFALLDQGIINIEIIIINLLITLIMVFIGIYTFRKEHKFFVDWL